MFEGELRTKFGADFGRSSVNVDEAFREVCGLQRDLQRKLLLGVQANGNSRVATAWVAQHEEVTTRWEFHFDGLAASRTQERAAREVERIRIEKKAELIWDVDESTGLQDARLPVLARLRRFQGTKRNPAES